MRKAGESGLLILAVVLLVMVQCGSASTVTFTGSSASLSASAVFDITGSTLKITLTNTRTTGSEGNADLLTGVYWDWAGSPTLTKVSATIDAGHLLNPGTCDLSGPNNGDNAAACNAINTAGGSVSGEFAYRNSADFYRSSADYGVSSAGLGLFGPTDRFGTTDLDKPADPDGPNFSIGRDTGSPFVTNVPLIKKEVFFTFTLPSGTDVNQISNLFFQYGTGLTEAFFPPTTEPPTTEPVTTEPPTTAPVTTEPPTTAPVTTEPPTSQPPTNPPIPEPASLLLFGSGLLGLARFVRKRR